VWKCCVVRKSVMGADMDEAAFYEKWSFEAKISEHFHTMELPGLDMKKEIASAKVLCFADMEPMLGDEGAIGLSKALSTIKPDQVTDITLTRNEIGDEGCAALAAASNDVPNLDVLCMMKNSIGNAGMVAIAEKCKTAPFTCLVLSANNIGDDGLKAFAASVDDDASFKKLNKLYLDRNPIGDEGAIALASVLHKLPDLEYVALQKCKIGDKGLNAITAAINKLGALNNAEYFWIQEQDPPCSEEAIAALKFACKGKIKSYVSWPPPIPGFGYDWGKWGPAGRPLEEQQRIERELLNPPKPNKGKGGGKKK